MNWFLQRLCLYVILALLRTLTRVCRHPCKMLHDSHCIFDGEELLSGSSRSLEASDVWSARDSLGKICISELALVFAM